MLGTYDKGDDHELCNTSDSIWWFGKRQDGHPTLYTLLKFSEIPRIFKD